MWLRHISTPRQRRRYLNAKRALEEAWPDNGAESFETRAANNELLDAWSEQRFGRRLERPGARSAFKLSEYLSEPEIDKIVHGGMLDESVGDLRSIPWWRWIAAMVAVAYGIGATSAAIVFSALVISLQLPTLVTAIFVLMILAAFIGHSLHAKLILIDPLRLKGVLEERRVVSRMREEHQ